MFSVEGSSEEKFLNLRSFPLINELYSFILPNSNTNLLSIIVYERVLFFSPKYQQEYDSDVDIRCVLS